MTYILVDEFTEVTQTETLHKDHLDSNDLGILDIYNCETKQMRWNGEWVEINKDELS